MAKKRSTVQRAADEPDMLFGYPKYDVESLASKLTEAKEAESTNQGLYKAALKFLKRRQTAVGTILKRSSRK